jgi:hypothetical protein
MPEAHAQGKLERKNLDLIVLNSLEDAGAGFGHDTNKVTLLDRQRHQTRTIAVDEQGRGGACYLGPHRNPAYDPCAMRLFALLFLRCS